MTRAFLIALVYAALSCATAAGAATEDPKISIAFVGDIMLADTPGKVIKQGRDPLASFASLLRSADIRVGNLECVVATKGKPEPNKPFTFRAHPRTLKVLKRHFDVVSVANNHSGDFGPIAFSEMLDRLDQQGITYFGGGKNLAQAHTPLVIERNGLRIAFLGYNEFFPRKFEADHDTPGIAWSEDEQVRLDITKTRSLHRADLVIAVMHWGLEHEPLASPRQRQLARLMIDAGADAVVGAHPHVTQDTDTYRGKPIIYSLGNFLFDSFSDEDNNTGWLLHMELTRQGVTHWRTHVAKIDKEGSPHPAPQVKGNCWRMGDEKARVCQ